MPQSCTSLLGKRKEENGISISTIQASSTIFTELCQTKFNASSQPEAKILASNCTPLLVAPKKNPFCSSLYVSIKIPNKSKLEL